VELKGKVAVVIGASAGIGRAYALALAGAGATVIAAARTLGQVGQETVTNKSLMHVVRVAESLSGHIHAQVCDVKSESDVSRTIDQTIANFGRIDVLVNNAGLLTQFDPMRVRCEDWDETMHVNLLGPYLAIRYAAPHMRRQRSGSIINITARAGGFMSRGQSMNDTNLVYAVSKAALNRLTFFMSEELKPHGVAVNALSPGIVATETVLALAPRIREEYRAKEPTPEVLGPALLYLAQQTADTLTGQILHSDDFGKSWP
jgi:NAD(P)-dependent dehydrogenase (short-subunit alcohol dehydrogenase family)